MKYSLHWLRSLFFIVQMYIAMFVMALYFTPLAIINRSWAYRGIHTYCRYVRWTARWMVNLDSEIRGEVPTGEVLVASKHQSFFDIIMLVSVLPRPKFIMKKELRWAPIPGYYAWRIGCVMVDRGKRGGAIEKMKKDVANGMSLPGQLMIYPQGTRVAPGAKKSYKIGTAVLYEQLAQPCVPVACNVGVFWPRHGIYRKPGLAIVEFLPAIPAGLAQDDFMQALESTVETSSNQLMKDAGFHVKN